VPKMPHQVQSRLKQTKNMSPHVLNTEGTQAVGYFLLSFYVAPAQGCWRNLGGAENPALRLKESFGFPVALLILVYDAKLQQDPFSL
jgi:hypothetical protein